MNRILIIDPGKGWGQFVSKMYCFQKLAEYQNSKVVFLTKRSTQAEYYLRDTTFCDEVIYFDEPKKGIKNIINNIKSLLENINELVPVVCAVEFPITKLSPVAVLQVT